MNAADPKDLAWESFRQLFFRSKEKTRRVLVEFYESDWEKISALKETLDLSWKDLFHAIAVWFTAFESDPKANKVVSDLMRRLEVKR